MQERLRRFIVVMLAALALTALFAVSVLFARAAFAEERPDRVYYAVVPVGELNESRVSETHQIVPARARRSLDGTLAIVKFHRSRPPAWVLSGAHQIYTWSQMRTLITTDANWVRDELAASPAVDGGGGGGDSGGRLDRLLDRLIP